MKLQKKTMRRLEWKGIEERSYAFMPFSFDSLGLSGQAGLLRMARVDDPFSVLSLGRPLTITQTGYTWLHLAPINEDFWATVMFDDDGTLFQYYFDVVGESHICENGDSWFTDLFLDEVMDNRGRIQILDEDELKSAYAENLVDEETVKRARLAQRRLLELTEGRENEWRKACEDLRARLLEKL